MPESAQYTRLSDANTGLYAKWSYGLTRLEKQLIVLATIFGIVIFALAIALARCESKVHPPTPSPKTTTTEAPTTTTVAPTSPTTTTVVPPTTTVAPATTTVAPTTTSTVAPTTKTTAAPITTTTVAPITTTTVAPKTTTKGPPNPNNLTRSAIPAGLPESDDTKIKPNPEVTTEAIVQKGSKVEAPEEVTKGEVAYESILKKARSTTPAVQAGNDDAKLPPNPEVTTEAIILKASKVEAPEEVTKDTIAILKKARSTTPAVLPLKDDTKIPSNPEVTTGAIIQKASIVEAPEEVTKDAIADESLLKKADKLNVKLDTGATIIRFG